MAIFSQYVCEVIDTERQVDVFKVFDKLNLRILPAKSRFYGFSENLILFLESYLLNRELFVWNNGFKSSRIVATSGVHQGSNLGPLLFSLFINDPALTLSVLRLYFEDDLEIYTAVDNIRDYERLQIDLNLVDELSNKNSFQNLWS